MPESGCPDGKVAATQCDIVLVVNEHSSESFGFNSRILLGEDNAGAASLPPLPGRGIWQFDNEVRFQSIWLDKPAAEAALAALVAQAAGTERVTPCLPLLPQL